MVFREDTNDEGKDAGSDKDGEPKAWDVDREDTGDIIELPETGDDEEYEDLPGSGEDRRKKNTKKQKGMVKWIKAVEQMKRRRELFNKKD